MNRSESIIEIAKALAAAQAEVENASKNSKNDHFKNSYADLAEVLNTVRPVFARHGISITQFPSFADGVVTVETVMLHVTGEYLSGSCSAPVTKSDPQGVGSAITYLRRYSLAAMTGVAQEDDDGNAAAAKPKPDQSVISDHLAAIEAASDVGALKVAFAEAIGYARKVGDAKLEQSFTKAKDSRKQAVAA